MNYAAVCRTGHVRSINVVFPARRLELDPSHPLAQMTEVDRFCGKCGTSVITACTECEHSIPVPNYDSAPTIQSHCTRCRAPHPWGNREQRIGQLIAFVDLEENLDAAERLELIEGIDVLSEPEDLGAPIEERVRAGNLFKKPAPGGWGLAKPILIATRSAELQRRLGLSSGS
jgi:hypothetical protein